MNLRRHASTVILVALAAVLAVVVLVLDRRTVTTEEADRRALNLLDAWREADIEQVTVRHEDLSQTLRRPVGSGADPARWALTVDGEPAVTDPMAVADFLSAIDVARFERPASVDDPAALGLDAGPLAIEIAMGGLTYRLRVGAAAPSPPGARYVEVTGGGRAETTYVISGQLVTALATRADGLRSRELLPVTASSFAAITYENLPGKTVRWRLQRQRGEGSAAIFLLERPGGPVRASSGAVDALFAAIGRLQAERFLPTDTAQPEPAARLSLEPREAGAPARVLVLGGPCEGGVIASRAAPEPLVACVAASAVAELAVDPGGLVDGRVIGAVGPQITELKVADGHGGEPRIDVARKGDGWTLRAPDDGSADADAVDRWLEDLLAITGAVVPDAERADLAKLGLDAPVATLRVISLSRHGDAAGEERIEQIDVGAERDGAVHVYRREDDAILRIEAGRASSLLGGAASLRSLVVVDVPLRQTRGLRVLGCVEGAAGPPREQRLARDRAGAWTLLEPTGPSLAPDPALATALSKALSELRAVRWVAEEIDDRFGLRTPWCVLELEHEPPLGGSEETAKKERIRIALGAKTEGGYYARRDERGGVFVVPRAAASAAGRWLLDRAGTLVPSETVARVTLTAGTVTRTVEHAGNKWLLLGDDPLPRREDVGQTVREVLDGLVAEEVVRRGEPGPELGLNPPSLTLTISRAAADEPVVLAVGGADVLGAVRVRYVRRVGVPLVYAVAESRLAGVLDLF